MIPQEEMTRTADRLTDALTAAAAIMTPERASALGSPIPGTAAFPTPGPARDRTGRDWTRRDRTSQDRTRRDRTRRDRTRRDRTGRLRAWLVPVGAAASVTAVIVTSVALVGHPGTGPAPAAASGGPGITSLAGIPSDPGTRTPPPEFYVTIVNTGISQNRLPTTQVRRTSDGKVTGTLPALPAGWFVEGGVSATADNRTFIVEAGRKATYCYSSTQTRFYQFNVTVTGRVSGLRAVGKPVTGEPVSQFSVSPNGTKIAFAEQSCPEVPPEPSDAGVIHVMDLSSGSVRSWRNTVSAATPARVTTQIGAMSWTANGRILVADYNWKLVDGTPAALVYGTRTEPGYLAVLALDTASPGGSLQSQSRLLFSEGRCDICVYQALVSPDGSTLTAVAMQVLPRSQGKKSTPGSFRQWVLRLSAEDGQPTGIVFSSVRSGDGLAPVLSADGQAQHWILDSGQQFGWISGGKLVPLLPPGAWAPSAAW